MPGTTRAINYRNLTGATVIGFRGTVLLAQAKGEAKVQNRHGAMSIKARFEQMEPATRFGPRDLTYVLWAVTPVGRPVNLGEVIVRKNGRAGLEAHTNLQTFGLVVTAEPHFAVAQVSNLVVLENVVTRETLGQVEEVEARYELLPAGPTCSRGTPGTSRRCRWTARSAPMSTRPSTPSPSPGRRGPSSTPRRSSRKHWPSSTEMEAEKKKWKKPVILLARQLVQQAEDARLVAAKRQEEARQERERQAADQAQREAESAKAEAERTRAQAEAARQDAERARQLAAQEAQRAKEQASREVSAEKLALRKKLREQLNRLLETRETEHGVEVSLSDLLFPTGKAALLPATREKLAKIAGVILAYPGIRVSIAGHTDGTGTEAFNRNLSLRRSQAVRAFLVKQGLAPQAVAAQGHGSAVPIASNDTPTGRQQNRRVELILTGGAIGF